MTLAAKVSTTLPLTLTITSDKRKFSGKVTVNSAGDSAEATYSGTFPVTLVDSAGRSWVLKSDDGTTAVYAS